ncbi:uncharacterized protein LOC131330046 [Rhododendron vialii]|uniref:uncharacterized protein LOC131330046 n=1 Tax=Rhododendron vialii TaxID=182163 RepID=UPI00265E1545|nr:uncharacterized protein LOC131330046 [Rhododendron vialii]
MLVGPEPKRPRTDDGSKWTITFTEKDLDRIQLPHNDALVVTLRIKTFNIRCVLVDQGSSTEVMYYSLFKDLKLSDTDLRPSKVPLIGFNGAPVWPFGMITLLVHAGSVVLDMEFVVVNVPSPYNVIVGRTWLHKLKAIASTYHQVICFIGANGRHEDLYGDQSAAKICYVNAVRSSKQTSQVNLLRPRQSSLIHSEAVIEEVNRLLNAKAIREEQYPRWLANTVVVKKKKGKWRVCVDYSNLNDTCLKDFFPLPRIDQLIDATAGHDRLSFMDTYRGYH